jgi:hypothetical protein
MQLQNLNLTNRIKQPKDASARKTVNQAIRAGCEEGPAKMATFYYPTKRCHGIGFGLQLLGN